MPRSLLNAVLAGSLLGTMLGAPLGCAHHAEVKGTRESVAPETLSYTMQIDTTRLVRGTGLPSVAASARLIEENLASYFKVREKNADGNTRSDIIGEAPAPGYGVHVVIEERPDQYCFVSIDVVAIKDDGTTSPVAVAPYSVQYGVAAIRQSLSSLRGSNRPPLSRERFDELRKQATRLAASNQDQPMNEQTFARTPRPLEKSDEAPRYYAPADTSSTLRGP